LGGSRNGVAIRTTVGRLRSYLESSPNSYFDGGAQYRRSVFEDTPTDEQLICTKPEAYAYEREFRVFTKHSKRAPVGGESAFTPNVLSEVIDVRRMLRYIYISLFSSTWLESTVTDTISKLAPDVEVPIRKSTIQDE
jgi:hypothetical protein